MCKAWEDAARAAESAGCGCAAAHRLIMSKHGGMLGRCLPFKLVWARVSATASNG